MNKGFTLKQPPHGYVRYVDHLGSDQRIVEAARVSYGSPSKGPEQDEKLLNYLLRNRHTSPFEQCSITYNIKFPIFLMRQFVRHRTFRLNEWSGRYSELADEFYTPEIWRLQDKANKQGSFGSVGQNDHCTKLAERAFQQSYDAYQALLANDVAKELARMVLPVGIYTEIYVNCDLHNLMHFLRLRLDAHAQKEIRDVAQAMRTIAAGLFPWTMAAFAKYRVVTIEEHDERG
jgi:thymidylate synthase (FAD)